MRARADCRRRVGVGCRVRRAAAGLCVLLAAAAGSGAQAGYRFNLLELHDGRAVFAQEINDAGQVLARTRQDSVLLTDGEYRVFDGLALALNEHGAVAGTQDGCATVWDSAGSATCLKGMGGRALDLNDRGEVLGTGNRLWRDGVVQRLASGVDGEPTLTAADGARRLNGLGQVLGVATLTVATLAVGTRELFDPGVFVGVVWTDGVARPTALAGSVNFLPGDLNDLGQAVASGYRPEVGFIALLDDGAGAVQLPDLDGYTGWSFATALNDGGDVVGRSAGNAVLWREGAVVDLNSHLPVARRDAGWVLTDALDINEAGSIVGMAYNTLTGRERGFVLSATSPARVAAVPEPAAWMLLATGLAVLGAAARRQRAPWRTACTAKRAGSSASTS